MMEEVGGLEMVHTLLLGVRAERFGEDKMHTPDTEDTTHTPLLAPDMKYVKLADSHTRTHSSIISVPYGVGVVGLTTFVGFCKQYV